MIECQCKQGGTTTFGNTQQMTCAHTKKKQKKQKTPLFKPGFTLCSTIQYHIELKCILIVNIMTVTSQRGLKSVATTKQILPFTACMTYILVD